MTFNLTVRWYQLKGDIIRAPDILSHYPVWEPWQVDDLAKSGLKTFITVSPNLFILMSIATHQEKFTHYKVNCSTG